MKESKLSHITGFYFLLFYFLISANDSFAEDNNVYGFLNLPYSHTAAVGGGDNVSSPVSDVSLVFSNPARLRPDLYGVISMTYMNYMSDVNIASCALAGKINRRSSWFGGIRYIDYGTMPKTTESSIIIGDVTAKDMALTGGYSWKISDFWTAGGTFNFIYSVLADYYSLGVSADVGVYYNNPSRNLSFGAVLKNAGTQIKAYDDYYENLPWDIRFGISYKLMHAPFRFNLTVNKLDGHNLSYKEQDLDSDDENKDGFAEEAFKHVLLGFDFIPSEKFNLSLGYNYKRSSDLSINQRSFFNGFTAGVRLRAKRFDLGVSYGKYHVSDNSLMLNLSLNGATFGVR